MVVIVVGLFNFTPYMVVDISLYVVILKSLFDFH